MSADRSHRRSALPVPSRALLRLFHLYLAWYLPRHFHALRLAQGAHMPDPAGPVIVYLNHASWWDPLICMTLARRLFPTRRHFAPMDAEALARYPLLGRLGMFAVQQHSHRGAAQFLRSAAEILAQPDAMLWITPQGAFTDVRERPAVLMPGLAALLARHPAATALPLAIEYTFWDERLPEVLMQAGAPQSFHAAETKQTINVALAGSLTVAQDDLAKLALARDPAAFDEILHGSAGVGFVYDALRRVRALFGRSRYQAEHSGIAAAAHTGAQAESVVRKQHATVSTGAERP